MPSAASVEAGVRARAARLRGGAHGPRRLADEEARPAADLDDDAANVFREHGKEHEQHAEQERDDRDGRRPARDRLFVEPFAEDRVEHAEERDDEDKSPMLIAIRNGTSENELTPCHPSESILRRL